MSDNNTKDTSTNKQAEAEKPKTDKVEVTKQPEPTKEYPDFHEHDLYSGYTIKR
jgi:hypothetical protein